MAESDRGAAMTRGDWPSIDHSLCSPNGSMSKAARERAEKRETARLFAPWGGHMPRPTCPQPTPAERNRRQAAELRALADRGMCPRKYRKEAARLEAEADRLTAEEN
jgi:hypothetical protein